MNTRLHAFLHYLIAAVWFINGLFCKLLDFVPRHRLIVSRILGDSHSVIFTQLIGLAELIMCLWILSKIRSKLNGLIQILVIMSMNILELFLAPDLLLWGKANFIFALLFCGLVYYQQIYAGSTVALKQENVQ